jgi:hypothetical protein
VPLIGIPTTRPLVLGATNVIVEEPAVRVPVTAVVPVPTHCACVCMGVKHMAARRRKGSAMADNRLFVHRMVRGRSGVMLMFMGALRRRCSATVPGMKITSSCG